MKKYTNIFERLMYISDYYGFKSVNNFAKIGLGYKSSEKINRLKKPNTKPSVDILLDISNKFEDVNLRWLLTGKGNILLNDISLNNEYQRGKPIEKGGGKHPISPLEEKNMLNQVYKLKTDHNVNHQEIPLYNIEATAGIMELFRDNSKAVPIDTIKIPNLPKSDGALFVTGDSMYPLLKSGDIVIYKEIHDKINDIFWGEMYLVSIQAAGEEYVSVKYIQKSDQGNQYIKLVSQNSHHQPKDVHLDKVNALALVKASIRINAMG